MSTIQSRTPEKQQKHISVVVRHRADQFEPQGFVHIIQNCTQGSSAVVSIMAHILGTLKSERPEINQVFFRQDNAGCYHSTCTILSVPTIEKEAGIRVAEIGFSDPQGGKGPADRMAATIKGHITRFINEGNDVTNAKEMENAILSHGGLPGIRVVMLDSLGELGFLQQLFDSTLLKNHVNFKIKPKLLKMPQIKIK